MVFINKAVRIMAPQRCLEVNPQNYKKVHCIEKNRFVTPDLQIRRLVEIIQLGLIQSQGLKTRMM